MRISIFTYFISCASLTKRKISQSTQSTVWPADCLLRVYEFDCYVRSIIFTFFFHRHLKLRILYIHRKKSCLIVHTKQRRRFCRVLIFRNIWKKKNLAVFGDWTQCRKETKELLDDDDKRRRDDTFNELWCEKAKKKSIWTQRHIS